MIDLTRQQAGCLLAIDELARRSDTVFSKDVAAAMGVTKPTMCRATDRLRERGLLEKERSHRGLALTERGSAIARELLERRETVAAFLQATLQLEPAEARANADAIALGLTEKAFLTMRLPLVS